MWLATAGSNALRWVAAPVAAIILIPAAMIASNPAGAGAAIAALSDPLAVMTGRSPGARPAGALTQSKARLAAAHRPRSERVLPLVRQPIVPAEAIVPTDYVPGEVLPESDIAPGAGAPLEQIAFVTPGGGGGIGPFVGGGGFGGGGGIGPGGGEEDTTPVTTTPPVTITPPPTASVPEPATWVSMLLGFLVTGAALRFRPVVGSQARPLARAVARRG